MIVFQQGMCRTSQRTGEMMREQKDFQQIAGSTITANKSKMCQRMIKNVLTLRAPWFKGHRRPCVEIYILFGISFLGRDLKRQRQD